MRKLGGILLTIGFFGAAFVTVRHADSAGLEWQTIEWGWYALPFVVGVIGVSLLRTTAKATDTHAHKLDADLTAMRASLDRIVDKLERQCANRDAIQVYDVHGWIDEELVVDLGAFVEVRESLIPLYGMQAYANIMSDFAGGERSINRAWSASADGYIDEVLICLDRALTLMRQAQAQLREQEQAATTGEAAAAS